MVGREVNNGRASSRGPVSYSGIGGGMGWETHCRSPDCDVDRRREPRFSLIVGLGPQKRQELTYESWMC